MPDHLHPLRPDADLPDIPLEALPDLLTAEQLLDEVRDTPHMHIPEALGQGLAEYEARKRG